MTPLTIGDVAKKFGITLRTLRFYESRRLINPRRIGGQRLYDPVHIAKLAEVLRLSRIGFTLSDISIMVTDGPDGPVVEIPHGTLMRQIEVMTRRRDEVDAALSDLYAMCSAGDHP